MKDGKLIYSLHIHVDLFTVRFHRLNPKFQTYTIWNWYTESTTNIIQFVVHVPVVRTNGQLNVNVVQTNG